MVKINQAEIVVTILQLIFEHLPFCSSSLEELSHVHEMISVHFHGLWNKRLFSSWLKMAKFCTYPNRGPLLSSCHQQSSEEQSLLSSAASLWKSNKKGLETRVCKKGGLGFVFLRAKENSWILLRMFFSLFLPIEVPYQTPNYLKPQPKFTISFVWSKLKLWV